MAKSTDDNKPKKIVTSREATVSTDSVPPPERVEMKTQTKLYKPDMKSKHIAANIKTDMADKWIETTPQVEAKVQAPKEEKVYFDCTEDDITFDYLKFGSFIRLVEYSSKISKFQISISNYYENEFKFTKIEKNNINNLLVFKIIPSVIHFEIFKKLSSRNKLNYDKFQSEYEGNVKQFDTNK